MRLHSEIFPRRFQGVRVIVESQVPTYTSTIFSKVGQRLCSHRKGEGWNSPHAYACMSFKKKKSPSLIHPFKNRNSFFGTITLEFVWDNFCSIYSVVGRLNFAGSILFASASTNALLYGGMCVCACVRVWRRVGLCDSGGLGTAYRGTRRVCLQNERPAAAASPPPCS